MSVVQITEDQLQDAVIDCAQRLNWRVAHFRAARTGKGWRTPVAADGAGFPDLVLARDGRVIFAELKTERGKVSDAQTLWLTALCATNAETYLWRPSRWLDGTIEQVLR